MNERINKGKKEGKKRIISNLTKTRVYLFIQLVQIHLIPPFAVKRVNLISRVSLRRERAK